ncbi:hypothetical protein NQ315_009418 [Exocentrus adspersus]|uniref:OPA3-like protein CG13603 n=1 Tax=Exocentrus adspersus TaxID=1586481 RepID=A0AAV8WGW1_9CUCU|nr:hypothetical protein NQ315_009418 [Exocentrus adspersus]
MRTQTVAFRVCCSAKIFSEEELVLFNKVFPGVPLLGMNADGEIGWNCLATPQESCLEMQQDSVYNWCEVKAKMWILNLGKPVNIPVLNEAMAIELGANLLGEGIIFLIAAGILLAEYNRSARKEAAKEEMKQREMSEIRNSITELYIQSEEQGAQLRELTRKLGHLDTYLQDIGKSRKPPATSSQPKNPQKDVPNDSLVIEEMSFHRDANLYGITSPNLIFEAINDLRHQFCARREI